MGDWTVSGDGNNIYVNDATGRIVATCNSTDDAALIAAALNAYQEAEDEMNATPPLVQLWYRGGEGIHAHPEEWPLNMTARIHARCTKVWIEDTPDHQTLLQRRAEEGD